ncbi:MAG: DNA alkylation repair protein [Halanaerobiales bacterium]
MCEFNIEQYVEKIESSFREIADPEKAKKQKQYMKNKFEFFGINAQPRRKAVRKFKREENRPDYQHLEPVIKKLWQLPEREYQYFGTELLERYKRQFDRDIIFLFEYMITNQSWWDTVDRIAKKLVGVYLQKFPGKREKCVSSWVDSGNIWLQRTALLFQLDYKKETDPDLLFEIIAESKEIDEFFIQKAIGWALREYSKVEPEQVEDYINSHQLSSLSTREGIKVINRNRSK